MTFWTWFRNQLAIGLAEAALLVCRGALRLLAWERGGRDLPD